MDREFIFEGVVGVYKTKEGRAVTVGDYLRLPNGRTYRFKLEDPDVFVDSAFERPMPFGVRIIDVVRVE